MNREPTIDEAFYKASLLVGAGAPLEFAMPEHEVYVKAYRLREFQRCPKCGRRMYCLRDPGKRETRARCDCGFDLTIADMAMARARPHFDAMLLDICRNL